MCKKLLLSLLIIFLIPVCARAQNSSLKYCITEFGFSESTEANEMMDKVLNASGLSKNFVLRSCSSVPNAAAVQIEGVRYIFYNNDWMNSYASDSWASMFTLAHEVGHHVNGHTLDWVLIASEIREPATLAESRRQELEADEFAGYVLGRMGASLEQTQQLIYNISKDGDDTYSTHPNKSKRLLAVERGYRKNNTLLTKETSPNLAQVYQFESGRWEGEVSTYTEVDENGYVWNVTRPNGRGTFYFNDGSVYSGSWSKTGENGYGELHEIDGSYYKGNWLNGNPSGKGIRYASAAHIFKCFLGDNGVICYDEFTFEGIFDGGFNLFTGEGKLTEVTDSGTVVWEGLWDGWMNLDGKVTYPSGKVVEGSFNEKMLNSSYYYDQAYESYSRSINDRVLPYDAMKKVNEGLSLFPRDEDLYNLRSEIGKSIFLNQEEGNSQEKENYWNQAIRDAKKANFINKNSWSNYLLFILYSIHSDEFNLEELQLALDHINEAIDMSESDAYLYNSRGEFLWRYNGWDDACPDFKKAFDLGYEIREEVFDALIESDCK